MTDTTETLPSLENLPAAQASLLARLLHIRHHREFVRFTRFLVVGTIGAVIDFGTYSILNWLGVFDSVRIVLPFGQALTGLGIAGTFGFTLAVISNFLWNRYWTYPDSRSKPLGLQLLTFFSINVVGLLIRTPILENAHRPLTRLTEILLPLSSETATWLGETGAWALAVIVVLFWNFFVNRYLTYNDVK